MKGLNRKRLQDSHGPLSPSLLYDEKAKAQRHRWIVCVTWGECLDFQFRAISTKHLDDNLFHSEKGSEMDKIGYFLKSTVRGSLEEQD